MKKQLIMHHKFENYLLEDNEPHVPRQIELPDISKHLKTSTANKDLILVAVISTVFLVFAMAFDLYEQLYMWSRQYDFVEIDELFLLALVLFPGLIWFAVRRWREAVYSYRNTIAANNILEKAREEQDELIRENRSLYRKISEAQEEERKRIAMDLHDIFGQHLTAIHANASTVKLKNNDVELIFQLSEKIIKSSEQLSRMARLMFNELRPPVLENIGLNAAIKNYITDWLENHHQFHIEYTSQGDDQGLQESFALIFYRTLQEALTNIVKHSQAKNIAINMDFSNLDNNFDGNVVVMTIEDDGQGFETIHNKNGLGLVGIRERVLNSGGEFTIDSDKDSGTRLQIRIAKPVINNNVE